jgi:hypothetical protein
MSTLLSSYQTRNTATAVAVLVALLLRRLKTMIAAMVNGQADRKTASDGVSGLRTMKRFWIIRSSSYNSPPSRNTYAQQCCACCGRGATPTRNSVALVAGLVTLGIVQARNSATRLLSPLRNGRKVGGRNATPLRGWGVALRLPLLSRLQKEGRKKTLTSDQPKKAKSHTVAGNPRPLVAPAPRCVEPGRRLVNSEAEEDSYAGISSDCVFLQTLRIDLLTEHGGLPDVRVSLSPGPFSEAKILELAKQSLQDRKRSGRL